MSPGLRVPRGSHSRPCPDAAVWSVVPADMAVGRKDLGDDVHGQEQTSVNGTWDRGQETVLGEETENNHFYCTINESLVRVPS